MYGPKYNNISTKEIYIDKHCSSTMEEYSLIKPYINNIVNLFKKIQIHSLVSDSDDI